MDAEVGHGEVVISPSLLGQASFYASEPLVAFNGIFKEKPAIFAHVTYERPLPTISYVVVFLVKRPRGHYGTRLIGSVPRIAEETLFPNGLEPITTFDVTLGRHYFADSRPRSYLSASCPTGLRTANRSA